MGHFHTRARKAGYFMAAATIAFSLTLASAADSVDKKGGVADGEKPAEVKAAPPAKTDDGSVTKGGKGEVKEAPKTRKPATRRRAGKIPTEEQPHDARLTVKQVMEFLKKSRDFSGRNLSGLRLVGVDLSGCSFKGADLSGANLERADLNEAVLERADLSGANMRMTDLRLTGMKGARLERTQFDGAFWPDGTICAKGSVGLCKEK